MTILISIIWTIIFFIIAWIITYFTTFNLKDTLFVEGILLVVIGISVTVKRDSRGLSLMGLGQNSAQYMANANLEITRKVNENLKNLSKSMIRQSVSGTILIVTGILCIAINFII